jgi:uncharacterized protein (TIGR02466 family)
VKQTLWQESIIYDSVKNEDISLRIKELLNESKKENNSIKKSNIEGFQTQPLTDPIVSKQLLHWSADLIKKEYVIKPNIKIDMALNNFWINENYKHSYNISHTHPGAHLSGVYYLEIPENSGNIFFEDFNKQFTNLYSFFEGEDFYCQYTVENCNNQLIIFPSNILHGVQKSLSNQPRISVSFNLVLQYEIKNAIKTHD